MAQDDGEQGQQHHRHETDIAQHGLLAKAQGLHFAVQAQQANALVGFGTLVAGTQRGQLATERALIDDNGDGVGREAGGDGTDGSAAARLYLDPDVPGAPPTDEVLLMLLQRRAAVQVEVDELKERRQLMTPGEYQVEFEKVMIEFARVAREIRRRVGSSQ